MFDLTRCLLDKVTARRMVEGLLGLAEGRELTEEERLCDYFTREDAAILALATLGVFNFSWSGILAKVAAGISSSKDLR